MRETATADPGLAELVYELLDAHVDTMRLVGEGGESERVEASAWAAHLDYLRDLQRVGRERLARLEG